MFNKIIITANTQNIFINIIDDVFVKQYTVENPLEYSICDFILYIIKCYTNKEKFAQNIILFMRWYEIEYKITISRQIKEYIEISYEFEKLLPEIQKYINLL